MVKTMVKDCFYQQSIGLNLQLFHTFPLLPAGLITSSCYLLTMTRHGCHGTPWFFKRFTTSMVRSAGSLGRPKSFSTQTTCRICRICTVLGRSCQHTVDGRNPAPADRWFIPLFIGFQPSKVVYRISSIHSISSIFGGPRLESEYASPTLEGWRCWLTSLRLQRFRWMYTI